MASVTVIMNPVAVNKFKGWAGPVGISVDRLAHMIAVGQKLDAPVRTGRLKAEISVGAHGRWAGGIQVHVGTNPTAAGTGGRQGYSYLQNEGTLPHKIRARNAPALRFFWVKVGRVVHFQSVNHPGHRGTHWADRSLPFTMRVWR